MPSSSKVSIIIPILNEYALLQKDGERLLSYARRPNVELVFADGGSTDGSLEWLSSHDVRYCQSAPGRARQMNAAASQASGDILLFLHADSHLPADFMQNILSGQGCHWGFFLVALDNCGWPFRLVSKGINFRSQWFRVATGDQAIFVSTQLWSALNGYRELALMEDIDLSRRLKKRGLPYIIRDKVITSARRWEKYGVVRTVLLMWWLQLAFKCGVSPQRIRQWYS